MSVKARVEVGCRYQIGSKRTRGWNRVRKHVKGCEGIGLKQGGASGKRRRRCRKERE